MEKYGIARRTTDDDMVRRMHIAYWIIKATDAHSEYVTLIAFPRQQWLHESVRLFVHCHIAFLVYLFSLLLLVTYCIYIKVMTRRYRQVFFPLSPPVMFADTVLGCSLKVDKCTAPANVQLSARLLLCTNRLPVCVTQCDCSYKPYVR